MATVGQAAAHVPHPWQRASFTQAVLLSALKETAL
jgi:hypothetical protein